METFQKRIYCSVTTTNEMENQRGQIVAEAQIVIIKDEETNPAKWPLAKITKIHPGSDGNTRVVTLKLQNG